MDDEVSGVRASPLPECDLSPDEMRELRKHGFSWDAAAHTWRKTTFITGFNRPLDAPFPKPGVW